MKFDKKNLRHWIILMWSTFLLTITLPLTLLKNRKKSTIITFGHKLNGNILALHEYANNEDYEVYYLTMDPSYCKDLKIKGTARVLNMLNLRDMIKVARCSAIISDHGSQNLIIYEYLTSIKFIDVWHGVPFKTLKDATEQKRYDEVWVSSDFMKEYYTNKLGFLSDRVIATGYARWDRVKKLSLKRNWLLDKYELPNNKKYVLYAPTWQHQDRNYGIIPFSLNAQKFLSELNTLAEQNNSIVIIRTHLNSENMNLSKFKYSSIIFLSYKDYPDSEAFLAISDILISDWSSIVFDYLHLKRPTIFIDTPPPFGKDFTVGPEARFGDLVNNFEELKSSIADNLKRPNKFSDRNKSSLTKTLELVDGRKKSGSALHNYEARIKAIIRK